MSKNFLTEAVSRVRKLTGTVPVGEGLKKILREDSKWKTYVYSLAQGLPPKIARDFIILAENSRIPLMENATGQLNQYESLTLPILRQFYPRLVARDIVTVTPIDKPEVIKAFLRVYFGSAADTDNNIYPYQFPYIRNDESAPDLSIGVLKVSQEVDNGDNLFTLAGPSYSQNNAVIGRNLRINGIILTDTNSDVYVARALISPDVDGNFFGEIVNPVIYKVVSGQLVQQSGVTITIKISGNVNYETGVFSVFLESSNNNYTPVKVLVNYVLSPEKNKINPKARLVLDKIPLRVKQRQISAEWTIPFEQDTKALYNLDLQEELVNIISKQIAIDIDKEILEDLEECVALYKPAGNMRNERTFYVTPPTGYAWGANMWLQSITPKINYLSGVVYTRTMIGPANVIVVHSNDSYILQSLNDFRYSGTNSENGEVGYGTMQVNNGLYKVVISQNATPKKMLILLKPEEEQASIYFYAPYVPVMISPYPLGANPTLTVFTRYANKAVRPEGVCVLNVDYDTVAASISAADAA